jgi:hypothetical protein
MDAPHIFEDFPVLALYLFEEIFDRVEAVVAVIFISVSA